MATVVAKSANEKKPLFIRNGGYGVLLKTVTQAEQRHFFVPAEIERALDPEDLVHFEHNGCFALPNESESLMRAYLLSVQPDLSVIDAPSFCKTCVNGNLNRINLLLLWSMFSAGASYVPVFAHHTVKK